LLGDDRETNNETTPADRQQILIKQIYAAGAFANKHDPTATNPQARIEELLEAVFYTRSVPRSYKQNNRSKLSVVEF
jgi:hypothetical protein